MTEHGKQAAYNRGQTDQDDEELEKLSEPPFGTESVDGPEQNSPDDDCNKNADYERNHHGLALLDR